MALDTDFGKKEEFLLINYLKKHFTDRMFSFFWVQDAHYERPESFEGETLKCFFF
jgi:hypothetical protein